MVFTPQKEKKKSEVAANWLVAAARAARDLSASASETSNEGAAEAGAARGGSFPSRARRQRGRHVKGIVIIPTSF